MFTSDFGINVAHEVLPDFDSASSFQDVNANVAPTRNKNSVRGVKEVIGRTRTP